MQKQSTQNEEQLKNELGLLRSSKKTNTENIPKIQNEISELYTKLTPLEVKKEALYKEEPRKWFFFGGQKTEEQLKNEKTKVEQEINQINIDIQKKKDDLKKDQESLADSEKRIEEIEKKLNEIERKKLEEESAIKLKQAETQNKKEKEEFQKQIEELKKNVEEQKKTINKKEEEEKKQKEEKERKKEEEETVTLTEEEFQNLIYETRDYLNSIPELVERNGGYYDESSIDNIRMFLIENELTSLQEVKEGVSQALKEIINSYGDENEDFEGKDVGELIVELDNRNKDLIKKVQENDEEAVKRAQDVVNGIKQEISNLGLFKRFIMAMGFCDFNGLQTALFQAKEGLRRAKKKLELDKKKAVSSIEKHGNEMNTIANHQLERDKATLNDHLYKSYSELDMSNIEPNTSLEGGRKKGTFSLVD